MFLCFMCPSQSMVASQTVFLWRIMIHLSISSFELSRIQALVADEGTSCELLDEWFSSCKRLVSTTRLSEALLQSGITHVQKLSHACMCIRSCSHQVHHYNSNMKSISIASSVSVLTEMRSRGASGRCLVCLDSQANLVILGPFKK